MRLNLRPLPRQMTRGPLAERPSLSNIERWWRPSALTFLLRLKAAIDALIMAGDATLLSVAFCRTMMKLSNAAFNHQSMSFQSCRLLITC